MRAATSEQSAPPSAAGLGAELAAAAGGGAVELGQAGVAHAAEEPGAQLDDAAAAEEGELGAGDRVVDGVLGERGVDVAAGVAPQRGRVAAVDRVQGPVVAVGEALGEAGVAHVGDADRGREGGAGELHRSHGRNLGVTPRLSSITLVSRAAFGLLAVPKGAGGRTCG